MILLILRKMLNNKWMILCLLLGSVIAVAMVSSIPMFTSGVLDKVLREDLKKHQKEKGVNPGNYSAAVEFNNVNGIDNRMKLYEKVNKDVNDILVKNMVLPVTDSASIIKLGYIREILEKPIPQATLSGSRRGRAYDIKAMTGLKDMIKIKEGRMFSDRVVDGVYEVIAPEGMVKNGQINFQDVFVVSSIIHGVEGSFKIKLVGTYEVKDPDKMFLTGKTGEFGENIWMDYSLMEKDFLKKRSPLLAGAAWYYTFDYSKIKIGDVGPILAEYENQNRRLFSESGPFESKREFTQVLERYQVRERQLRITLWVFQVPILLMIAFYIFMISQLVIDMEKNEVAVIRSRGASRRQVMAIYAVQSVLLGIAAFLIGPLLGMLSCKLLGSADGFLEFTKRTAIKISLSTEAYQYSLLMAVFLIITMLVPVILANRINIIQHKQSKSRNQGKPVWKKYFLDLLLLIVAGYGLYSYYNRQEVLKISGISGDDIAIDPILYLMSTAFIFGAGLLFLRFYSHILRFVFWLGRKIWTPVFYISFIQVGRSGGKEQFLMLFLILTMSVGIYNANSARTINTNIEDRIRYKSGADVVALGSWPDGIEIKGEWRTNDVTDQYKMEAGLPPDYTTDGKPVWYLEPPYAPITKLTKTESITKVLRRNDVRVALPNGAAYNTSFMAVIPHEFGETAWFRQNLLSSHWYKYLNLLEEYPGAFLVSKSFQEKYGTKVGDKITIGWDKQQGQVDGVVYGIIDDYWPTYNPYDGRNGDFKTDLVVGNFNFINLKMRVEPYELWMKQAKGVTGKELSDEIEKMKQDNFINYKIAECADEEIAKEKSDPKILGVNGSSTMGFLVAVLITMIGFLIYWIMSVQQRVLQFGVFRAMGLSLKKIIGMIICEQILISGVAIFTGIIIAGIATDLFVPLLEMAYSSKQQVPPFRSVAYWLDFVKLYCIVGVMLVTGLVVLRMFIARIKIHQAVKLGEE